VILTNVNRRDLANSTAAMLDSLLVPPDPAPWQLWPDRQEDSAPPPATEPAAAQGDFVGWLHHHTGPVAVHLSCAPAGSSAELRLGDGEAVALEGFAVEGGTVRGRAALPIATQDGVDGVPNVSFELVRRGERLEGIASADLPGRCRVAHWVSLVRLREGLPSMSTPAGCLALVGGGGIPAGLYERVLAERLPAETRVAILSHASAAPGAGGRSEEAWRKHGVLEAQTIGPLTPLEEARSILEAAHVIWIPGGQQTRFMETLPRELADVVRRRLAAGAVAGGTSAGAAVASTIMIAGDAEEGEGRSSSLPRRGPGLGLWPDALVDQHFSERGRFPRLLAATLAQPEVIGVGLDEGTAVIVQGRRFEVLGRGTVTVIDARGAAVAAGPSEAAPTARDVRIHLLRDGMAFDLAPAPK
jgi:cyanophycinase